MLCPKVHAVASRGCIQANTFFLELNTEVSIFNIVVWEYLSRNLAFHQQRQLSACFAALDPRRCNDAESLPLSLFGTYIISLC